MARAEAREGFSLIEVVVSILIAALLIVGLGKLGLNLFHQRATYDAISAATSLAEKQWEILRDIQNPLTSLSSGTTTYNASGTGSGPYQVSWTVADPFPTGLGSNGFCPTPTPGNTQTSGLKQVSIRVYLPNAIPAVDVTLVTYLKVC